MSQTSNNTQNTDNLKISSKQSEIDASDLVDIYLLNLMTEFELQNIPQSLASYYELPLEIYQQLLSRINDEQQTYKQNSKNQCLNLQLAVSKKHIYEQLIQECGEHITKKKDESKSSLYLIAISLIFKQIFSTMNELRDYLDDPEEVIKKLQVFTKKTMKNMINLKECLGEKLNKFFEQNIIDNNSTTKFDLIIHNHQSQYKIKQDLKQSRM